MGNRGSLIILSGPSGVGKGTVRQRLMEHRDTNLFYSVSMTTRSPRPGEENGREYYFVTPEQFQENIDKGNFLEYAQYVAHSYGTPKDKVEEKLNQGINVLLEIDVKGAMTVLEKCPDAISIFLVPPSFEDLEKRIRGRSTETEEVIAKRLEKARSELALKDHYGHIVVNDDVERAASEIAAIIKAA